MKILRIFLFIFISFSIPQVGAAQTIWPGDVNNNGIVNEVDLLLLSFGYGQAGQARKTVTTEWSAQTGSGGWTTSAVEGIDLAFLDCNGDGSIDTNDVAVIKQNFGLSHSDVVFTPDVIPQGILGMNPAFSLPENQELVITPADNGKALKVPIELGSATIPITNLLGISFYIKADPQVFSVDEGAFALDGWLPANESVVVQKKIQTGRSGPGDLVVAYSKTNQSAESGSGLIGTITLTPGFILEDNVPDFKITIDSILLIDINNNPTPVLGTDIVFNTVGFRDSTFIESSICQGESLSFNNAQISAPDTYYDTLQNQYGADSIIILNLAVLDSSQVTTSAMICQGESYAFNSQALTTSGFYRDTLQNLNGCDSIVVLALTVLDTSQTADVVAICQGESYTFKGQNLITSGIYRDTLQNLNGCDSVLVLNLQVLDTAQTIATATICTGDTYSFNSQLLSVAGSFRDTLQNVNGCDSVLVLNLQVLDTTQTTATATICNGDTYSFNSQLLNLAGSYRDTLQNLNGCDSIVVLDLTVEDTLQTQLDRTICAGDNFIFNGQNLMTAGVYRDTLQAANGCNQYVVLNLTVEDTLQTVLDRTICVGESFIFNEQTLTAAGIYRDTLQAANGCNQYVQLNLIVEDTFQTVFDRQICPGDSFFFNDQSLTEEGTYRDTIQAANGCNQFVVLNLAIEPQYQTDLAATICARESYLFGNQTIREAGVYERTLQAANGCDSLVVLELAFNPIAEATFVQSICSGESVNFNGRTLSTTGIYYDTLPALNGCDSLMVLDLKILSTDATIVNQTICENSSFSFNGMELTEAGEYEAMFQNGNGCDSLVTLNLAVSNRYETELNKSICRGESMNFNGRNVDAAGTYEDMFTAANGCDSLVTLNLAVAELGYTSIGESICAGSSRFFNGQNLRAAGTYVDTLSNINGCDSIVELTLEVLPIKESASEQTICEGDSLDFFGFVLTATNSYMVQLETEDGCDSMVILNLLVEESAIIAMDTLICPGESVTFGNSIILEAGTYSQTFNGTNGCDSIVTLNLTIGQSGIEPCRSVSIEEELLESISIYPNPVVNDLIIQSPNVKMQHIRLVSLTGQELIQLSAPREQATINMANLTPGVYWVLIQTEYGLRQEKVVKF